MHFVGLYYLIISLQCLHEWMPVQWQYVHVYCNCHCSMRSFRISFLSILDKMLACVSSLKFCCQQQ